MTLPLADSLCGKWTRAKDGLSETKPAFEQLTECLDAALVQEWTEQERVAMEQRADDLNIYQVAMEKRRDVFLTLSGDISLMQFSTNVGGNTLEVVGNGSSARKPFRCSFRTHRGPLN